MKPLKVWSIAVALAMLTGCASMRENVPLCRAVSIGTGSLLGATLGGTLSGVVADYPNDWKAKKNWTIGTSTAGGAALGGLIGWGISTAVCKEPLPPPAPPAPYIPPPPPPPPTQRRGG